MWNLVKQFLTFRLAQKSTRGAVRILGFGRMASLVGLVSGVRALLKYRRTHRHA